MKAQMNPLCLKKSFQFLTLLCSWINKRQPLWWRRLWVRNRMDQLVLRPWRPRVFCRSRRRIHSWQFQPARPKRKNYLFQRSDADDFRHRKPRLWRLKWPKLPRNLPISNGPVWSYPCSLYSLASWTRIDEGEVPSWLIRLLPSRPLRTPKRASHWSLRRTVDQPCESLLPKMPRRVYSTLKATWHWRRLLRQQFPPRLPKSKSFPDITFCRAI